ncbi:PLP-dependent aminotransferase family protein [Erwiniaceae bacterium BAC15a-03b]|uniref:PLP-dependent aminotransferase family protein n=1 Tax=Winslowiella arboricola TaxID=2978220 RepID=A0A9J6PQ15_9GAMM|nr:PLP-dependent aminotransferase family protein [Winslowiella arboricola]MCU5773802.1 PLP-dependent aminotransferase family protein [Winslowiella arboricola]MCU5777712.1 PLP-dependent aminotransferase family protein [Winslowiella arboricola]
MPGIDKNSGPFSLTLNREARSGLTEQIRSEITQAIREGRLKPGARMPSCRDLAVQLGVARGTVRAAYDMLADSQLLVAKGAAGTFVAQYPPIAVNLTDSYAVIIPSSDIAYDFDAPPLTFQMGIPADDAFPVKVWSRIVQRHARTMVSRPLSYPDPRGSLALRQELVAYLAMARGVNCQAEQIIITNGYAGALGLICLAMNFRGTPAWIEEPGYLLACKALGLVGIEPVAVSVDEQGIRVSEGIACAPQASFALVTAGQQAPLGMTLSLARRSELLKWAAENDRWIVEDDYLGELQLGSRAAPALASLDTDGRVMHIGTFSKTLSPSLRLGFVVVPAAQAARFADIAAVVAPASSFVLHNAVAEFLRDGHFLRHLRRMKRIYADRLEKMTQALAPLFPDLRRGALSVVVVLPPGTADRAIAREALAWGMAPSPLSAWYQRDELRQYGLVLGATNMPREGFAHYARKLRQLVDAHTCD